MHGTYGLLWYMKHLFFPDKVFAEKCTFNCMLVCWLLILGPYMIPAWLIASGNAGPEPSKAWLYLWITVYILSVSLTLEADA